MGHLLRIAIAFGVTIANAVAAIVYYRAGKPIIDLAVNDYPGPATSAAQTLDTLVPLALLIIELGVLIYVVYGPVRRERAQQIRGVRRP
jgi:hypothetical protein